MAKPWEHQWEMFDTFAEKADAERACQSLVRLGIEARVDYLSGWIPD